MVVEQVLLDCELVHPSGLRKNKAILTKLYSIVCHTRVLSPIFASDSLHKIVFP